ncbi:cisplatin damage response ATP-dependent DNA ligase [Alphaproteobacteria bacterium]|nr:cisplatin damage response ATP-dependent DNA ligase [Alphaproteobacteria bacterium]
MLKFSALLKNLIFSSSNKEKNKFIINYLKDVNIREAGYTIAALTGNLKFKNIRASRVKQVIKKKVDNTLFDLSYDYVGDLADTVSLIWSSKEESTTNKPSLLEIVDKLNSKDLDLEKFITEFLNSNNVDERWAFIKLLLGGFRVGVSESFIKNTLAEYGNKNKNEIEKIWNGIKPPYISLLKWLEDKGPYPKINLNETFHSMMLAHTFDKNKDSLKINPENYIVEYKWDGIRVQVVCENNKTKIYSRTGENITNSFSEFFVKSKKLAVLDGELLAGRDFTPLGFGELQKRINKKKPSKKLQEDVPVFIRLYDILFFKGNDVRNQSLIIRKEKLVSFYSEHLLNDKFDISEIISFSNFIQLEKLYKSLYKSKLKEGLMIKKKSSMYVSGRKQNLWFKWKRAPKYIDAILMYAQRGHGKRSSYYSDFTFGVFDKNQIVPIAKAYSGYTDKELLNLDKFVRENTIASYGPVREVNKKLVVELAFDSMQISKRHKSGIALRFPRFHRIRWDKPVNETLLLNEIKSEFIN